MIRRRSFSLHAVLIVLVLAIFTVLTLGPLLLTWMTALKSRGDYISNVLGPPRPATMENFHTVWIAGRFNVYYLNSILVVVPVTLLAIALSLAAGYGFAYFPIRGRNLLFAVLLFGMMVPYELIIIRLYYLLREMGLHNRLWGLILPQIGMSVPFGTFLFRSTLDDIPTSLVEAAEMDGAGTWTILRRIVAPLMKPTIVTAAVFFFIWTWNDFLLPLVIISSEAKRTLPIGMAFFQGKYTADIPVIAMGAAVITIPVFAVYAILQRFVISGLTAGAVKE